MATTIITKNSSTASAVPTASDLVQGELAVNVADKRIFTENASAAVVELGTNPSSLTLNNGTANGVAYLNGSKVLTTGSALVFDGTNLGVGVTPYSYSSGKAIDVGSTGAIYNDSAKSTFYYNNVYNNAGYKYKTTGGIATAYLQDVSGGHVWLTAPSGTAGNAISFTQAMTLDASGNLGIGITSPTAKTHIVQAVSGTSLKWSDNTYDTGFLDIINQGARISANNNLVFNTYGADRVRIDSSGNLLVGTTSNLDGSSAKVSIASSGTGYGVSILVNQTTASNQITFKNPNGFVGVISTSGSITLYNTTSDYRLKTVIGPVADAGQRIDALQPVEYIWNASGERTRGFLAHKFQEVYAGSVSGTKDAVDAEGKPVYQSMQASSLEVIADLVAEIQSLRQRLAALESK